MKTKNQTAVEFLIKEFSDILGPLDTKPMQDLLMMDAMKKAKEIEKEQSERSYSEEEVNVLINLLKQTTEYEVLQSFRDKVEEFKKK